MSEHTDVVIVGGRCAGSAAAIAFARRGRKVVVVDSAAFPSDTLSTHLLFPPHWAELDKLGARERVLELGAPLHVRAGIGAPGVELVATYSAYDGWAAGGCVRRPGLDLALVQTAREAGAEVRERVRVTGLERDATGRVAGVRYRRRHGEDGTITAALVVGADGRGSTVARLVGTREHHRWDNQRMMAYAYYEDCHDDQRDVAMQWRNNDDLVTVFPCNGGQFVALQMPPAWRADEYRTDPEAAFAAAIQRIPPYAERLRGCTRAGKVMVSYSHPSYFRHSHGPGWALAGDAGHFKDPVTAQGIRDALRFGRLLGEAAAPHLDSPAALDAALAAWEMDRDAQCLPMYQWANSLGRDDTVSVIESAAYRWFAARPERTTALLDVFSRKRSPTEVFAARRLLVWLAAAVRDPAVDRRELLRTLGRDARREFDRLVEYRMFDRRRAASARMLAAQPTGARVTDAPVPVD
ncbi:NAD(P)/FAD-dependent oxidoreductase [Mycolicibacterium sp.]|uniref:NAD(P)/FAD-dependent oxidoreductase n=1 Tax=Mycolicibacterium sp. TaxID=2320850 RepID=UPI00355D1D8C